MPRTRATNRPRPSTGAIDALVTDGSLRQALGATRSLGRAGLVVAVAERALPGGRWAVPAAYSRWSTERLELPEFHDDPHAFAAAVLDVVASRPVAVVIPCNDCSLGALRPWRRSVERHAALAIGSEDALSIAVDKLRTLEVARQLGVPVPATVSVDPRTPARAALAGMTYPAVVKPPQAWSAERRQWRLLCQDVVCEDEAVGAVERLAALGATAHVQPWIGGRREAISLMRAGGRVVASFAQVALRATPMLGGVDAVRESIPMPEDSFRAAVTLIDAIGLDGFSQVEFRRDSAGVPRLMEINTRLPGSVELATRCGVDFPLLLWRWAAGEPVEPVTGYRAGVRMRWLHGDARWLAENLRNPDRPDAVPARQAVAAFAGGFLQRQAYDFVDLSDPRPAAAEIARMVTKRLRRPSPPAADPTPNRPAAVETAA